MDANRLDLGSTICFFLARMCAHGRVFCDFVMGFHDADCLTMFRQCNLNVRPHTHVQTRFHVLSRFSSMGTRVQLEDTQKCLCLRFGVHATFLFIAQMVSVGVQLLPFDPCQNVSMRSTIPTRLSAIHVSRHVGRHTTCVLIRLPDRVTIPAAAATRQPAALQQHPSPGGGNKPTMHMSPNHNNPFPILCGGLAGPGGAGGIGPASNKAIVRGAAGSPAPVPSNVVSPGMRPVGAVGSTPPRGVGVVINGNGSVGEGVSGVRAGAGNGMAENINVKSSAAMNANSRNNGRATKALGSSAIAGSAGGGGGGGNGESGGVANKVQQEQQQHYHHQNQHQPSSSNNVASLAHLSQHRNAPGNYRRGGGNGEGPPGGGVRAGGGGSGPLQQHHQHQLHKGSGGNGGALSYGVGGSGVSNGGGGGALGGAGGVGVGRPGPGAFAPGVGRGHMGPMPPFGAHGESRYDATAFGMYVMNLVK